jgi:hypothetical protein
MAREANRTGFQISFVRFLPVWVLPCRGKPVSIPLSETIMAQTASVMRPKQRKWLRRLLLTLVFLVPCCVGGVFVFLWFSSFELNAVVAELDRLDPGWRLQDIEASRKVVPDAGNSALHIVAVGKLLAGQPVITPAMEKIFENLLPQVGLNEQQAVHLAKRLAILGKAAVEARKLKDMHQGRHPIRYSAAWIDTFVDHLPDGHQVCELLRWDAAWRAQATDHEGALESCLALQNAARSMGDEPFALSLLVRCGRNDLAVGAIERALAQCYFTPTSEPTLKLMQETFASELTEPTLLIALRGERAGLHQFVQAVDEGKVNGASLGLVPRVATVDILWGGSPVGRSRSDGIQSRLTEHVPGFLTRQHAVMLRFASEFVEAAKLPMEEASKRFEALEKRIPEEPYLARMTAPYFIKIRETERRLHANLSCALAALAAERFRIAQNRWPESLGELVKNGVLDAVPVDPYDGKSIRFKHMVDGPFVYSVGHAGTDQGFRLWDVSRRRQRPNPPVPEEEP